MDRICVQYGFCGCAKNGRYLHVTDLIPDRGTVSADQFAEWVCLAEGDNPNSPRAAKHKKRFRDAFVEFMGGEAVDAKELRFSREAEPDEEEPVASAPRIHGLDETCLYVENMRRARSFYEGVLGLKVLKADSRMTAYDLGAGPVLILLLHGTTSEWEVTPGGSIPPHDGAGPVHFCFGISSHHLSKWRSRLKEAGVDILSTVKWPAPTNAFSIYFRDPDDNLVEMATYGLWRWV